MITIVISLIVAIFAVFLAIFLKEKRLVFLVSLLALLIPHFLITYYSFFIFVAFLFLLIFSYLYNDSVAIASVSLIYPLTQLLFSYTGLDFAIILQAYTFATLILFRKNNRALFLIFMSSAISLILFILGVLYTNSLIELFALLLYVGFFPLNPLVYISSSFLNGNENAIFFGSKIPILLYLINFVPNSLFLELIGIIFAIFPLIYAFSKHGLNRIILIALSQLGIIVALLPVISLSYYYLLVFSSVFSEMFMFLSIDYSQNLTFISSLSMIGIPLLPGFWAKFSALISSYNYSYLAIIISFAIGIQAFLVFSFLKRKNQISLSEILISISFVILFFILPFGLKI
ncbi:MAG: hypothetical protein OH318_02750 [Candidatus Parvarchaeota archaeon]|nr:hypothetical protein [Candidatus Rehaiarchaeum fermentans]